MKIWVMQHALKSKSTNAPEFYIILSVHWQVITTNIDIKIIAQTHREWWIDPSDTKKKVLELRQTIFSIKTEHGSANWI
jgi:hypothetical protein